MGNLGVELDAVQRFALVRDAGEGSVGRGGYGEEVGRETREFVAVGHPHFELEVEAGEEGVNVGGSGGVARHGEDGVAVFPAVAGGDVFTVVPGNLLKAVADAEDGNLRASPRYKYRLPLEGDICGLSIPSSQRQPGQRVARRRRTPSMGPPRE